MLGRSKTRKKNSVFVSRFLRDKEIKSYNICFTAVGELCLNSCIEKGDITATLME